MSPRPTPLSLALVTTLFVGAAGTAEASPFMPTPTKGSSRYIAGAMKVQEGRQQLRKARAHLVEGYDMKGIALRLMVPHLNFEVGVPLYRAGNQELKLGRRAGISGTKLITVGLINKATGRVTMAVEQRGGLLKKLGQGTLNP